MNIVISERLIYVNRSGQYITNLSGELRYHSFLPSPLPPNPPLDYDEALTSISVKANSSVAQLEAISKRLPSVPLFVSMYVRKEALLSSQIEGTQATLDDILDPHLEENTNRNVSEVINYIKASDYAMARLADLPMCNRLLLEAHRILLSDVRGQERNPGEFRRSQNWIGSESSTLKTARFVPPSPDDMQAAMTDLEKYMNTPNLTDPLIKIALIHYQFETIHPFLDGNGRIGRLMVNLFLKANGLLTMPTLYISYFLKRNRIEYYDRLSEVREKGNYEQWVRFFLQGIYESAVDAVASIDLLTALHDKNTALVRQNDTPSNSLLRVFSHLENTPIISIKKTSQQLDMAYNTVSSAVSKLVSLGILYQVSGNRRERVFSYEDYLEILRKDT
jgi:Fic family protein